MREEIFNLVREVDKFKEEEPKHQKNSNILEKLFDDGIIDKDGNVHT